ncbi:MAG: 50S ribosomal protein L22 [Pseudomonadota bacterium]
MEARASVNYVRVSPRKARLVVDLVRGKRVEDALNILSVTPKASAKIVEKLLRSAVANASHNRKIDVDTLFVDTIYVNEGPRLKRIRARAMGRVGRIWRGTSHITVILTER